MTSTLQHRGYDGSVLFSAEDRCLHGRVLGIRDMISFGGASLEELEKNFCNAVDEYLSFCEATGKTPNKPFKGSFNVRIPQELHSRAAQFAEEHDRKLNAVIKDALQEYLERSA